MTAQDTYARGVLRQMLSRSLAAETGSPSLNRPPRTNRAARDDLIRDVLTRLAAIADAHVDCPGKRTVGINLALCRKAKMALGLMDEERG